MLQTVERWNLHRGIFRGFTDKPFEQSLSCGFINKSGYTEDIINEHYQRLAMVYVLRGSGGYSDSLGASHSIKAGDLFFRCPDRKHSSSLHPDSQWLECFVSVRAEWYQLFKSIGLMDPHKVIFHLGDRTEIPEQIFHFMEQLEASDTPLTNNHVEFEIVSLIRQILTRNLDFPQSSARHRDQLETARARIRLHATSSMGLAEILKDLGLSYDRLRSLFRKVYRVSPGDYRIQVRIEKACALLETTQLSLQEIADQLKYADAFTFSKQFKQRIGCAPSDFRRKK